ncbi:hypothetical protein [Parendozoicomonas haliclonae]|uniref:Uncharacterized protein n=1 Tax=Parendozoicomonas haliclonae TaxID=1960125 RepID=A0A1X7APN0_9GAMM|nr:hypothetical protein [Parendozoicomonas haliclonae]SMA50246.1 hypothetical protein EHSB41UT_04040 [Parendozoicomonas haliclonae]
MGLRLWTRLAGVIVLLVLQAGLSSSAVAEENPQSEPITRADLGWDISARAGSGWLPDYSSNRSGTFLRKGDRILFLEGMTDDVWASIQNGFYYGGVLPATMLGSTYMLLSAIGQSSSTGLGGGASPVKLSSTMHYAGYGVGLLAILNSWGWQMKNFLTNGYSSGYWNLSAQMAGGLESHYAGIDAFQQAQRAGQPVAPRGVNAQTIIMPVWMGTAWLLDTLYSRISGKMTGSIRVDLPACLAERVFVNIAPTSEEHGELRIHRIPRPLRNESPRFLQTQCSEWDALMEVMDRDRIDHLSIRAASRGGKLLLHTTFLDHRSPNQGTLEITTGIDAANLVWAEDMLVQGVQRRNVRDIQTLLHPDIMHSIHTALDCYQQLGTDQTSLTCGGTLLHRERTDRRSFTWEAAAQLSKAPISWTHESVDKTLLYFDYPKGDSVPYLVWHDGPWLELRGNQGYDEPEVSVYHFSERASYAIAGDMDYLVRYMPHAVLSQMVLPFYKSLAPSAHFDRQSQNTLDSLEVMALNYAPGWLTNLHTFMDVLRGVGPTQPSFHMTFSAGWRYPGTASGGNRSP